VAGGEVVEVAVGENVGVMLGVLGVRVAVLVRVADDVMVGSVPVGVMDGVDGMGV
jgi:hypothetical protein